MTFTLENFPFTELEESLQQCMLRDRHACKQKILSFKKRLKDQTFDENDLVLLIERMEKSIKKSLDRKASVPEIVFDEKLPIASRREEIAKAIAENQVVVLAGETGSGKTTQVPKICLELGRGVNGVIGHTQPRRIAARTVANRIAEELNVPLGDSVGYQVRFNEDVTDKTHIKLMTDGILLAEIQSDPYLNQYDTLIIDEAHERSLNIDFLLGYLKQLLPKRPDLKLIVTSATIDLGKFSTFFNDAPIIEVSGRTYPVEVRYQPWQDAFDDVNDAIVSSVRDLLNESKGQSGDILIFLSGEREIREASHAIKKANMAHVDVLPLYARLSLAEQNKIFTQGGRRKVVLSTNVAETSVTVPGIKYVIDPGTARISRYSLRTKVQRLPIEPISQASANQRKGRCGRVSDGICVRLYTEDDFVSRSEFTDAEILRTNLAAVILQMLQLRIGDVRKFSFIDAPDNRLINDGFKLLEELNAVDKKGRVTAIGKQLQRIPLDPRLARILVESKKYNCTREILTIVTALSIQDPRERPAEKQQASDEKHRRFWDEDSDFIALVNVWDYIEEQRQEISQNQLRRLCQKEFLNFMRLREWRELHHQVKLAAKEQGIAQRESKANYEAIHRSLLAGLATQVGLKDDEKGSRKYFGTRNKQFVVFPGSSQQKKKSKWIVAGEFIETSNLYAHQVAKIDPEWALQASEHLVKRNYFEPHYDVKSGQVKAYVRISLLGLPLVEKQRVNYQKVDDELANEIFIRSALVEGGYRGKGAFFKKNNQLIQEIHDLEAKSRRRDILVDDEQIFSFYREKVPSHIVNLAGFEHWRKESEQQTPDLLRLTKSYLMQHSATDITEAQFPTQLMFDDIGLPVKYHFEPGKPDDGVTVETPVELLHQIKPELLEWIIPGLLREKCIALVKGLPKQTRKHFVPVPEYVDKVLPRLKREAIPLTQALAEGLGFVVSNAPKTFEWNYDVIDDFYRINVRVVDDRGKMIAQSRDIDALRAKYKQRVRQTIQAASSEWEREGLESWDFDALPQSVQLNKGAVKVTAYPALVDTGFAVNISMFDNPRESESLSFRGICRLALLETGQTYKYLQKNLLRGKDIGLTLVDMGRRADVADDIAMAAAANVFFPERTLTRSKLDFIARIDETRAELTGEAQRLEKVLLDSLTRVVAIKKKIKSSKNALALALTVGDINKQLNALFNTSMLFNTPKTWFNQYPRFLKAIEQRLEKAPQNPQKDKLAINQLDSFWGMHVERLEKEGIHAYRQNTEWQLYRWMIEEYRVSLFAQTLKTQMPVSEKRLKKQWDQSKL